MFPSWRCLRLDVAALAALPVAAAGLTLLPPTYRLPVSVILLLVLMVLRERRRTAQRERALVAVHAALADAEANFRGVFESSTDVLCTYRIASDGAIRLDDFNPAAARFRDLDASARGKRLEEVLPAEVAAHARRCIAEVAASGEALRLECKLGRDQFDMEIIVTPLPPRGAAIDQVFISIRDITHLRQAQAAVARSEALHRTIAESTSDLIVRLSLPERLQVYLSPASR